MAEFDEINSAEEISADDEFELETAGDGEDKYKSGEGFSDEPSFSDEEDTDDVPVDPKKKKRKRRLIIFGIIGGIIAALIIFGAVSNYIRKKEAERNMYTDVAVERRTISNTITGSSNIEPNDSYNVMTMKSGDITADFFKEGDEVKKGDKLYQFDDEEARDKLSSAQNALTKAQQAYVDAVKQRSQTISANNIATKSSRNAINKALNSLGDARSTYNDQYVTCDISGKVSEVNVKEGDVVANGAALATVYDDSVMKVRLPFNDYDAAEISVGDLAEVTVTGSGDTLYGTVTEKAATSSAAEAHTIVVYTTIEVPNPGALTEKDKGSAVVNGAACSGSANFEYKDSQKLVSKSAGTVKGLSIDEGDSVYAGEQVAYIESTAAGTALKNAEISYDDAVLALEKQVVSNDTYSQDSAIKTAQLSLDDARINLKTAQDAVDDYVVEAPIEGTVVKKNAKNGDTRDSGNSTEALCVIYDLSSVKLSIDVDETEIALVKTGQKAKITADAVDGEFEGEITKVPVDGTSENGVTTYTIEIQVKEYGDLLPGMNVDAEIVVEEADDVLTVPVNSVNRGDIVFVKDDGTARVNDVTSKMKREGDKKNKKTNETPQPQGLDGDKQIPANLEVPKGYVAVQVETGINDTDYIEIKSGLTENDTVRSLNTENSSVGASFGDDDIMAQMEQNRNQQMRQMQTGGGMGGGSNGGGMGGGGGMR